MTDVGRADRERVRGAVYGLLAAALFGLSTPLAKRMLPDAGPLFLAALLYLGAGVGLLLLGLLPGPRAGTRQREAPLRSSDIGLLVGITVTGGILGPILMLVGLARVSGVVGSLLLNLEAPFTMLLALVVFGEHLGRRTASAAVPILVGAVVLTYQPGELRADPFGIVAIAGACLSWAIDNNLTQRLSLRDPIAVVRIKALGAGIGTLGLALVTGQASVSVSVVLPALVLGAVSYGVSIVLDVYALRVLGAAREAAFFATAPFVGALAAVPLLGESLHAGDLLGMAVMALGVALLVRERHSHMHTHEAMEHEHAHVHDEHHDHEHAGPVDEPHTHLHRHTPLVHEHPHVSDAHHRHTH